jgi:bacterial/archaeal transporter family-2 protein
MRTLAVVLAFAVGALVTLQIGSNMRLKEAVGGALPAIIVSSALGVALLGVAMLAMQLPWPSATTLRAAPASAWLGGVFGAVYAIVTVLLARHMGAATLVALLVAGQLVCSVVMDHFGVLGFEPRSATAWRLAGCGLMLAGFFLIWKF